LDADAVLFVKGECLVESGEGAGSFFVRKETGKGETRMVVDGDVKRFGSCTWIAVGTMAGGANAWLMKAAKLFNIKMKELPWSSAFVTQDRRLGWIEGAEAIKAVTLKDAGKGSFRDGKNHEDLSIGAALFTEREDLSFEWRRSFARLT